MRPSDWMGPLRREHFDNLKVIGDFCESLSCTLRSLTALTDVCHVKREPQATVNNYLFLIGC